MKNIFYLPMACLCVGFTFSVHAQPGSLDATFGAAGKAFRLTNSDYVWGEGMALQSDGKILITGEGWTGSSEDITVARFNADGSVDNTFNSTGFVETDFYGGDELPTSIIVQTDGKILVAGLVDSANVTSGGIVRYNANGSLDNTFGNNGKLKIRLYIGAGMERIDDIILQADGKIIAVGSAKSDVTVMRLNSNGSFDMSFNAKGWINVDIAGAGDASAVVKIQSDGKIVVGALADNAGANEFGVIRLNTNGTLDNTFSSDGKTSFKVSGNKNYLESMAIQADNKIVLVGYILVGSDFDCALARLNADGTLDNTFSGDGLLSHALFGEEVLNDVLIQPDGKILVCGYTVMSGVSYFAINRYNTDGSFDNTFDTDGKTTQTINNHGYGEAILLQKDGKILVGGTGANASGQNGFAIIRFFSGLTVGIDENMKQNNTIAVYPNPMGSTIQVQLALNETDLEQIYLLDAKGSFVKLLSTQRTLEAGEWMQFDVSDLSTGIYSLIILSETGVRSVLLSK